MLLTIEANEFIGPLILFSIELLHLKLFRLIELLTSTDFFSCAHKRNAVEMKAYDLSLDGELHLKADIMP